MSGRIFVIIVAGVALIVAANSTQAIVMLGGLAVAYGFQMYPALIGICLLQRVYKTRCCSWVGCGFNCCNTYR